MRNNIRNLYHNSYFKMFLSLPRLRKRLVQFSNLFLGKFEFLFEILSEFLEVFFLKIRKQ